MGKILLAAVVVGGFFLVSSGAAQAGLTSYTYEHELIPTNLVYMTTSPTILNGGVTDFSFTYNLTEPFPGTHPDPDRAYLPYTDIFKSATLALYFSDDEQDDGPDKFKLSVDDITTGALFIVISPTPYEAEAVSVEAAFSPDGILTYNIHAQVDDFIFNKSVFSATWEYDDSDGGVIAYDEILPIGAAAVPEPATMLLLGTGLVGVAGAVRRKKKLG